MLAVLLIGCVQNQPGPTYDQAVATLANEIKVLDDLVASRQSEVDRWGGVMDAYLGGSKRLDDVPYELAKKTREEMSAVMRVEEPKHKQRLAELDAQIEKQQAAVDAAKKRRDGLSP